MKAGVPAGTQEASLCTPLSAAMCHLVSAAYQPHYPHSASSATHSSTCMAPRDDSLRPQPTRPFSSLHHG